jgi:hypothetical protein
VPNPAPGPARPAAAQAASAQGGGGGGGGGRVFLLRLCRLPARRSGVLSAGVLTTLDLAVGLHLCFGCWAFSARSSAGAHLFPRPFAGSAANAAAFLSAAGLGGAGVASAGDADAGVNCTRLATAAGCAGAGGGGLCEWAGAAGGCGARAAYAGDDPLQAVPRLLNDLVLPYFAATLLVAALVVGRRTPLWRLARWVGGVWD